MVSNKPNIVNLFELEIIGQDVNTCADVVSAHDSHGFPPLIVITSLLLPFEAGPLFPFVTLFPDGRIFPPVAL